MESIRLMDGVVDIYMPDFKLWDSQRSLRYLLARDYPEAARRVVKAMHEQVGELRVDENGLALRGVIVRHLVMPGLLDDTGEIVRWLAGELSPDTYVNVMDQYYPAWKAKTEAKFSDINRGIRESEFEQALAYARQAGLWRLDRRWRPVLPRFEFVEIPPGRSVSGGHRMKNGRPRPAVQKRAAGERARTRRRVRHTFTRLRGTAALPTSNVKTRP
jgi:putative pyruvate formate lyase activating enzyme